MTNRKIIFITVLAFSFQLVNSFGPQLETYYEAENSESAPFIVTNPIQGTTINDKLLVRPRLLFARTRSKEATQVSGSEMRNIFSEPDFDGKYASWSEYDRISSPSFHHLTKEKFFTRESSQETRPKNTIVPPDSPVLVTENSSSQKAQGEFSDTQNVPRKIFQKTSFTTEKTSQPKIEEIPTKASSDTSIDKRVVKQIFVQVHEIPSGSQGSESLSIAGAEDEKPEDQNDLTKEEEGREARKEVEEEVSKHKENLNRYSEKEGKGYPSSGYVAPEIPSKSADSSGHDDIKNHAQNNDAEPHDPEVLDPEVLDQEVLNPEIRDEDAKPYASEDVPRYPPLDRNKLYNKSFLIYLKDFRPGQY